MNQPQQEYEEVTDKLDVPGTAGIEGFILAIRSVLKMPRVMNVQIDSRGQISYTRWARREEPRKHIEVDFETVSPAAIIRNGKLVELDVEAILDNAAICVAAVFHRAATDHMFPVAWVVGRETFLPDWHYRTTGVKLPPESAYGLPVFRDRFIPDETLLLACAYGPGAAMIDARAAYKITMPIAPVKPVAPSAAEETTA